MAEDPGFWRNLWRGAGPDRTLLVAAVLICCWSLLLISAADHLTESRILLVVTLLGALAAGSAWISIRWRRAEREERRRLKRPFTLD